MTKEIVNKKTGEITSGKLNEIVTIVTTRKNGTTRIQQDFSFCPTLAEQHTAHLSDINYLIEKHKPDELAAYIAARGAHKQEIIGHDFAQEPDLQGARNVLYQLRKDFEALPEEVRVQFKNHVEFLKFIDNPANREKMIKLGLLTAKEIKKHTEPGTTTTQEAKDQATTS